jgi:hypothetical protein
MFCEFELAHLSAMVGVPDSAIYFQAQPCVLKQGARVDSFDRAGLRWRRIPALLLPHHLVGLGRA